MSHAVSNDPRQIILDAIAHLDHVLPGQAPIHDFVHHNTLHGFQHMPFEQALASYTELTGIDCYQSAEEFRRYFQRGRITAADLDAALQSQFAEQLDQALAGNISRGQLYRAALLHDLNATTPAQLQWHKQAATSAQFDAALWHTVLGQLEIAGADLHPEDLLDLTEHHAESWLSHAERHDRQLQEQARSSLADTLNDIGNATTLRSLLLQLSGQDILDQVRPTLIRLCASLLDEGQAAWGLPGRQQLGFYQAWRQTLAYDAEPYLQPQDNWPDIERALPDEPIAAILQQLQALGLASQHWPGYLQRLALEIPGWSGMINWRQTHNNYRGGDDAQPRLADYLALRLVLDRLYGQQLCRQLWHCEAHIDKLRQHFALHLHEFWVRRQLFSTQLPEYLLTAAEHLRHTPRAEKSAWQDLAERIWTWQHSPLSTDNPLLCTAHNQGWRVYRLCRALELTPQRVMVLNKSTLLHWLTLIDEFSPPQRAYLWLCAYERHYRDDVLQALRANHGRGRWATRDTAPQAHVIFCMDDREEGIRRHLEELNPAIETLGAAGFFGVAMNYQGLDDSQFTPLCPVVVVPAHNVVERQQPGQESRLARHQAGQQWRQGFADGLNHGLRRYPLASYLVSQLAAPFTLSNLLAKSFFPGAQQRLLAAANKSVAPEVPTRLSFSADDASAAASPQQPRLGFTNQEQADRVAGFLRNIGLTYGFAELVVLMGHGSISQNNPHLAAYDCGACSGRHGGPNARLFAALANRVEVRALLAERGIAIPEDSWFIGAEHNTGNEDIVWYDLDAVPPARQAGLAQFTAQLAHAQRMSAHERCRRLASAPRRPKPLQALRHFLDRSADFSQARPELGHATNAAAFIGRRSATQGAFFDRRLFLISYDPTQDADGTILEGILLAVGPVGAGINLEYYFSTVNNDRLGCGSKVPHNLTGFFAVMEGASSDLRTGLPKQMIEIHEAMRLQIVVEAKTQVLEAIYGRQESLRELIGGGWVHLCCQDPASGELFIFERGVGFVAWQPQALELPMRDNSPDCYREASEPLPTMLIRQPAAEGALS